MIHQESAEGGHGGLQRLVLREPVVAGGQQRKGHRPAPLLHRQGQGAVVGLPELGRLAVGAVHPHRPHRVDDVPGGQAEPPRDGGLSHWDDADPLAGGQQPRSGLLVDAGVHAPAHDWPGVGRVDDGVHLQFGDVAPDDLKGHGTTPLLQTDSRSLRRMSEMAGGGSLTSRRCFRAPAPARRGGTAGRNCKSAAANEIKSTTTCIVTLSEKLCKCFPQGKD